jgi:hypothetical protein
MLLRQAAEGQRCSNGRSQQWRKTVAADGTSEYVVSGVLFGPKASASLISSCRDEKTSNANYALFGIAVMLFVAPAPAKR